MAILKAKDVAKMNEKDRRERLAELRQELVRAGVAANRATAKTKEIKRAISRILTYESLNKTSSKEGELKKK